MTITDKKAPKPARAKQNKPASQPLPYRKTPPRARAINLKVTAAIRSRVTDAVLADGYTPMQDAGHATLFGASVIRSLTDQFGYVDDISERYLNSSYWVLRTFRAIGAMHGVAVI